MTAKEAKLLIGKRVQWETNIDYHRGLSVKHTGVIKAVSYKNVLMENGDYNWLPTMHYLHEIDPAHV
jgi:uncharacterized protein YfaT (DUF1175 family)